ncbi:hypothetical protein [Streptomyces sp. STR69]|uniref:hypothetical protein n=1 Tax=Streptomyces sp. STR69 TaxID=1796942 RepID=UPI003966B9F1
MTEQANTPARVRPFEAGRASLAGLPPLPVGWAVRRRDALTPLARAFADTVARSCTERAAHARHRQPEERRTRCQWRRVRSGHG